MRPQIFIQVNANETGNFQGDRVGSKNKTYNNDQNSYNNPNHSCYTWLVSRDQLRLNSDLDPHLVFYTFCTCTSSSPDALHILHFYRILARCSTLSTLVPNSPSVFYTFYTCTTFSSSALHFLHFYLILARCSTLSTLVPHSCQVLYTFYTCTWSSPGALHFLHFDDILARCFTLYTLVPHPRPVLYTLYTCT